MAEIAIRPGTRADLELIEAIQIAAPEASHWSPESYLPYHLLVAAVRDTVAGFLVWRENGPDEGEILNVAVDPGFRRQGLATALMRAARAQFAGTFFLEVRESNSPARLLYGSFGFQIAGRRPGYYQSPPESAVVMKLHSC